MEQEIVKPDIQKVKPDIQNFDDSDESLNILEYIWGLFNSDF